jgi:hypothetical protein
MDMHYEILKILHKGNSVDVIDLDNTDLQNLLNHLVSIYTKY